MKTFVIKNLSTLTDATALNLVGHSLIAEKDPEMAGLFEKALKDMSIKISAKESANPLCNRATYTITDVDDTVPEMTDWGV